MNESRRAIIVTYLIRSYRERTLYTISRSPEAVTLALEEYINTPFLFSSSKKNQNQSNFEKLSSKIENCTDFSLSLTITNCQCGDQLSYIQATGKMNSSGEDNRNQNPQQIGQTQSGFNSSQELEQCDRGKKSTAESK